MAKVKMFLDLDFDEVQKIKADLLLIALDLPYTEKEIITKTIALIEKVQDQSVDNPENKFTHKQVYGS